MQRVCVNKRNWPVNISVQKTADDEGAMREKPDIPDELLRTTLQNQYDLVPVTLEFLPVGLDYHAGVYRVVIQSHRKELKCDGNQVILVL